VQFQRRFNLLDDWYDNDEETIASSFRNLGRVADLPRDTSLQRGVLDLLERGAIGARGPAGWISTATNGVAATDSRASTTGRNSRQGPMASLYCLAIV